MTDDIITVLCPVARGGEIVSTKEYIRRAEFLARMAETALADAVRDDPNLLVIVLADPEAIRAWLPLHERQAIADVGRRLREVDDD